MGYAPPAYAPALTLDNNWCAGADNEVCAAGLCAGTDNGKSTKKCSGTDNGKSMKFIRNQLQRIEIYENLSESKKVNGHLRKSTKINKMYENLTKSMQPKPFLEPWGWFRPFAGMCRVCAGHSCEAHGNYPSQGISRNQHVFPSARRYCNIHAYLPISSCLGQECHRYAPGPAPYIYIGSWGRNA